jgi:hypothetical protein
VENSNSTETFTNAKKQSVDDDGQVVSFAEFCAALNALLETSSIAGFYSPFLAHLPMVLCIGKCAKEETPNACHFVFGHSKRTRCVPANASDLEVRFRGNEPNFK